MAKIKTKFICQNCGFENPKWMGKCPECSSWNSFEEVTFEVQKANSSRSSSNLSKGRVSAVRLSQVVASNSDRIKTDMNEFNRVMGGGIVRDSITILTAPPGAGKSTLLLKIADELASKEYKVLYASGEESDSQIKSRADRILNGIQNNVWVLSDTSMDNILSCVEDIDPDLVIVDSIQTVTLNEFNSRPGSPVQTMECANELLRVAKNKSRPRAIMVVGQMTKKDEMAGLRALEHLVDAVLYLDGEVGEELRILSASKNRHGDTGEIGVFRMTEQGVIPIENPSEFFMTKRDDGERVAGSALSVIKEGSRSIIVEIESLISQCFTPVPSRTGDCLKKDQLNTLISILEQRGGMKLYDKNVVIKTTGGLKLNEQSVNLAVIMSIVSSIYDVGISNDIAFIAEVGLTGELKKVPSIESRVKELDRLGFSRVYVAKNIIKDISRFDKIKVIELKTLQEVIKHVFAG